MTMDFDAEERRIPAETAAMKVPPRNRWQVLLVEYELLDAYLLTLSQRIWTSGLVLIGLSLIGIAFMAVGMDSSREETSSIIGLMAAAASVMAVVWWILQRRLFSMQAVAEFRKREIEREMGMRSEIYLTFLKQGRNLRLRRREAMVKGLAEGDSQLENDLFRFIKTPEARPRFSRLMGERITWGMVPWILMLSWVMLYLLKTG